MIVLALLVSAFAAQTGSIVHAEVLVHSTINTTILVQNTTYNVTAGTNKIQIPFVVEKGVRQHIIQIEEHSIVYELPLTITGEKKHSWLWWLSALPLVAVSVFLFKKKRVDSS